MELYRNTRCRLSFKNNRPEVVLKGFAFTQTKQTSVRVAKRLSFCNKNVKENLEVATAEPPVAVSTSVKCYERLLSLSDIYFKMLL